MGRSCFSVSEDSGDAFGSASASRPQQRRQLRLAAELAEPVVDVLFQQRNGRLGRPLGRRFFALPPRADQLGIPNVAVDGLCPAALRGALNLVVARHDHQPPRGRVGADQLLDQLVGRLVLRGEADGDAAVLRRLAAAPAARRGRRTPRSCAAVRADRSTRPESSTAPAGCAASRPVPTPRPTMPVAFSRL